MKETTYTTVLVIQFFLVHQAADEGNIQLEALESLYRSPDIISPLMNQLAHSDLISTMSTDAD